MLDLPPSFLHFHPRRATAGQCRQRVRRSAGRRPNPPATCLQRKRCRRHVPFILHPSSFPLPALREECIARIKARLKRIEAGKNAGRSLFELADYIACLTVIDSRN